MAVRITKWPPSPSYGLPGHRGAAPGPFPSHPTAPRGPGAEFFPIAHRPVCTPSLHRFAPPSRSITSRRPRAPPAHAAHPRRPLAPPVRTACSRRPLAPSARAAASPRGRPVEPQRPRAYCRVEKHGARDAPLTAQEAQAAASSGGRVSSRRDRGGQPSGRKPAESRAASAEVPRSPRGS